MRFLPRFSLRFLLIAVTIFLIVFGVGAKYWKNYHDHEAVAKTLESLGFDVEEETDSLFGYVYAKRITGLVGRITPQLTEQAAESLRNLPDKSQLKRLSFQPNYDVLGVGDFPLQNHADVEQLYQALGQLRELQLLDLNLEYTTTAALQQLANLKKLESLKFHDMELPEQGLGTLLDQLPSLKQLSVTTKTVPGLLEQVAAAKLPNLEALFLSLNFDHQVKKLNLTRTGFGRFPKLRYLILWNVQTEQLDLEAGALPHLKVLNVSGLENLKRVDWRLLPQAAPQLSGLGIHFEQLTPDSAAALRKLPQLRLLYVNSHVLDWNIDFKQLLPEWPEPPPGAGPLTDKQNLRGLIREKPNIQHPYSFVNYSPWDSFSGDDFPFERWPSWEIKQYRTPPPPQVLGGSS